MNVRQSLYIQIMHGVIVVIVVIAATILAYNGTLDSATVAVIFGAAVALAGGSAQSLGSLGQTVNGKSMVSDAALANRETTLRTAMAAAAASEPHVIDTDAPPRASSGS